MVEFLKRHATIIKRINVVRETEHGDNTIGYILYQRNPTDSDFNYEKTYPFKKSALPMELHSPIDELDILILEAIKSTFPTSDSISFSIFGDYGKSKYSEILNRNKKTAVINIYPDISGLSQSQIPSKSFAFRTDINIYQNDSLDSIEEHYFTAFSNFERWPKIFEELNLIKFL